MTDNNFITQGKVMPTYEERRITNQLRQIADLEAKINKELKEQEKRSHTATCKCEDTGIEQLLRDCARLEKQADKAYHAATIATAKLGVANARIAELEEWTNVDIGDPQEPITSEPPSYEPSPYYVKELDHLHVVVRRSDSKVVGLFCGLHAYESSRACCDTLNQTGRFYGK